jgi:CRISPR-associated protein Cmr2
MSHRYLITLSLGPVQSLIAAARRTRDLWTGSWLLSEVSRAAARAIHTAKPGSLIFPAPENPDRDLQPQAQPGDEANIANIIRAEISAVDDAEVRAICHKATQAARTHLILKGEEAIKALHGLRDDQWQAQIDDILEHFAAWVRIEGVDYKGASERLAATLAARKATRDCIAAAGNGYGLPKSSLDGAYETVLPDKPGTGLRRKLFLSKGEQLDALGVIKRCAGQVDQFTAYSRIAADSWIESLTTDQQQRLRAAYGPLVRLDLATRVSGNHGIYAALPYDAQLLFDFRLENALRDLKRDDQRDPEAEQAIKALQRVVQQIAKEPNHQGDRCGLPVPYAAILQADGDRMGALLQQATTADQSRAISRALHGFASSVRKIVRDYRGHAIYAGGDDVLALLPLNLAVDAAKALADAFKSAMGPIARQMGVAEKQQPTLSVGLGIGHLIEPLGALRTRAQQAEKLAKGDKFDKDQQRNALAIILGIRSGGELEWRGQWDDENALQELKAFKGLYARHELPTRVAYDLRDIDLRLKWLRDKHDATSRGMVLAEVARMLERARTRGDAQLTPESKKAVQAAVDRRPRKLAAVADTLIIARWLAARTQAEVENN